LYTLSLHDALPIYPDSKIVAIEFVNDAFHLRNESFRLVSRGQHDDVAGAVVFGDQQSAPERTGLRIAEILRSIGETSYAGHRSDGCNPPGELSQLVEVTLRGDVG